MAATAPVCASAVRARPRIDLARRLSERLSSPANARTTSEHSLRSYPSRARSPGQGADPVPNGHPRQNALLEVSGHVRHASAGARRAKSSSFTAERHKLRVPTPLADQMQTALFEPTTTQVF